MSTVQGQGRTWATFRLADELFAIRVDGVQEVMTRQPLAPVPLAPPYLVGLLNLRGQIMPAIDLRCLLRFPARDEKAPQHLMVVCSGTTAASIIVDEIGDVLELDEGAWRPPPDTLEGYHREFVTSIQAIDGDMVLALQVETLLADDQERRSEGRIS